MSDNQIKIKSFEKKNIESKTGSEKYDIKLEKDTEVNFDKLDKGGTGEVEVKIKKSTETADDAWKTVTINLGYEGGMFSHGYKILAGSKLSDETTAPELKEDITGLGVKGFKLSFWITVVVIAIAVIGGLGWWMYSNRKEDKEEESL